MIPVLTWGAVVCLSTISFFGAALDAKGFDVAIVGAVDRWSNGFCTVSFFGAVSEQDCFCLFLYSFPRLFRSLRDTDQVLPEEPVASLVLCVVDSLLLNVFSLMPWCLEAMKLSSLEKNIQCSL